MSSEISTQAVYRWNPKVACRTLEGTAFVLLNSRLVSLNGVGTRIWELFESGRTVGEVGAQILREFDTTDDVVKHDVGRFVSELVERDMLVSEQAGASGRSE